MASKTTIPGRKVPQGNDAAFVPAPLPPKLNWTPRFNPRSVGRLERLKIVKQVGEAKRDRVYCANALLDILEEPAPWPPGMRPAS